MEVMVPVHDFNFDSTTSTPYVSAPSSPRQFGKNPFDFFYHYPSAPTSPTGASTIFGSSVVPCNCEETSETPRSLKSVGGGGGNDDSYDFVFDFSGQLEKGGKPPDLTAADELFEEGKIRAMKPPPGLSVPSSPRSPKSPRRGFRSPGHHNGEGFDPFTAATVEATRERGRDSITPSRSRKGSRSLSPMRSGVAGFFQKPTNSSPRSSAASASTTGATSGGGGGGGGSKWRLRDLFLFRSASEGRVTGNRNKDPLRKYTAVPSSNSSFLVKKGEDSRNSSFRSTDGGGSTRRGRGPAVSAHEIHYTSNRAVSEEMKKKTALPFSRQGLFGCLGFNPAVNSIARGFQNTYSFNRTKS